MAGIAVITEACIDVKDRACVDVCPVQCIYEFDPAKNVLFSEEQAGSGVTENTHAPNPDGVAVFGDSILYVNLDECTSCTACYQPDVCPGRRDLLRGPPARRVTDVGEVQRRRSERRSRPHLLPPAQPRGVRRLSRGLV